MELYSLIEKISDVINFDSISQSYITKSNDLYLRNNFLKFKNNLSSVCSFGDKVIVLDELNKPYFINNYCLVETSEIEFRIGALSYPLIVFYKKEQPRKYGIYDFFKSKTNFETIEWIGRDIFDDYIFNDFDKKIISRKVTSAQPLWQYDLANLGQYKPIGGYEHEMNSYQVAKFLGIWQNEVLVACEGGLILALSTTDGTLKRKWDKLPENSDKSMSDVFKGQLHQSGNVFQLNIANDKIFGLYFHHLVTIDLKSGEIQITALTNTFKEHFISAFQTKSGYSEDETHYYTTVMLDQQKLELNYMHTAVCALSKKTYKIDWLYRFDQDSKGNFVSIQIPQVANNKLYQLTANNVIYIFEREN